MTATGKKPGRRYSREQQQEDRSEGLFKARLAEVGWPCDRLGRDLGEDLHVRIYDDGASTGLSFYVQLKSTAKAERLTRRKTPALAYKLERKDIEHWEGSATLVVLVVWDVEQRMGWWRPIPEIIKELDKTNKGWRKNKTAVVSVPLANGTDDEGLKRLRWAVADHNLPLAPKISDTRIRLSFSATEEGAASMRSFQQALDLGDSIEIDRGFTAEIVAPPWFRRFYGESAPKVTSFEIRPTPTNDLFPIRIEVESPDAPAVLHYVELRVTKQGRKHVTLTNEHQPIPVHVKFFHNKDDNTIQVEFKIHQQFDGVYDARDAAAFELALKCAGATIRGVEIGTGAMLFYEKINVDPLPEVDLAQLRLRRELLEKLCFIQDRIARQATLSLRDGASREDVIAAEHLFPILSSGKVEGNLSLSARISSTRGLLGHVKAHGSVDLCLGTDDTKPVRLLNCDVHLGRVRLVPSDPAGFLRMYEKWHEDATRAGGPITATVHDLPVVEEYVEWLPEDLRWGRLSELAIRQEGYLTLSQARWTGYTDDIFLAMIPGGKVEQVAPDVFRLINFPRADREELIVLWLQTDRKGVISHDTALLLHELSNILPRRRHITVPPGWDPDDRQLGANVVLHHAEVGEDEIRWLGPVPYTAPLRTLRDCIASHLSPDLIEQAVDEGLQRGMFTEADLPPGARRGAA